MAWIGIALCLVGVSPYAVWNQTYDRANTDRVHGICLDSANHLVIVGESDRGPDFDCWIITLSKSGDSLRSWFYDEGLDEKGVDVTATATGTIGAAINVSGIQYPKAIIAHYDTTGELLWKRIKQETNPYSTDINSSAITSSVDERIYATGYYTLTGLTDYYYFLVGYDIEGYGAVAVDEIADSETYRTSDLVTDEEGDIYLGADLEESCLLRRYTPEGDMDWWLRYEGYSARGFAVGMDDSGYLYLAGDVESEDNNYDFLLLKCEPSSFIGNWVWPSHKAYDLGHNEYCRDIALDAGSASSSDSYLAGWQERGEEEDVALVKTDSAGNMLWAWVDTLEGKQQIEGIEVDEDGYIYLAGSHHNGSNWDMLVMKVRQPLTITGRVTDLSGAPMVSTPIKLTGDTLIEVVSDTDGFYEIEVYNGGSYTVEPDKPGWVFTPSSHTYDPLAHREFNQDFADGYWSGIGEKGSSTPIELEVTLSAIHYTLPYDRHGTLSIYDPSGQLVNRMQVTGSGSVEFSNSLPSGVYLVQLRTKHNTVIRKALILR